MNERISVNITNDSPANIKPRAFETIIYGGLTIGVLDAMDAVIFFGLRSGTTPKAIFQYIAAGLLGRASYEGGISTILLGIFLHFLIAAIIAAVFYSASLFLPVLIRRPATCGMIYGIIAYFVMNFIVVPLSSAPHIPLAVTPFLNGVFGHALLIGLPVALIARRFAKIDSNDRIQP